ncbi:MAG TPA: hypothetical protein VGP92_17400 [Acidimicrobiia bacterium]|nr:hypothetical protein [Acidimicrobiia bacterium]
MLGVGLLERWLIWQQGAPAELVPARCTLTASTSWPTSAPDVNCSEV